MCIIVFIKQGYRMYTSTGAPLWQPYLRPASSSLVLWSPVIPFLRV